MKQAFLDYYRCPEDFPDFRLADAWQDGSRPGYFKYGSDLICFGRAGADSSQEITTSLPDALAQVRIDESTCILPFNPTEITDNLRYERYVNRVRMSGWKKVARNVYYSIRPSLPFSVRRQLQRIWMKGWDREPFPRWPVDATVDRMFERLMYLALLASPQTMSPFVWFWPEGKSSCAIMTHDVETASGLDFIGELMDINDSFDIKSSFQIIPDARYFATEDCLAAIRIRGFEINVHDLKHDGHLYDDYQKFLESAEKINEAAVRFGSNGFRSGVLYRNLAWYGAFRFSYDMSVPNVGHLDPQPGGCCTVMPYFVGDIVELPLTTIQDYSLFYILNTYSLDLWKEQIKKIMAQNGLISFIIHPDYLNTRKARSTYTALLEHLARLRAEARVWTALPGEVNAWWRQRSKMRLVRQGNGWRIEGAGSERACLAYAALKDDKVTYSLTEGPANG